MLPPRCWLQGGSSYGHLCYGHSRMPAHVILSWERVGILFASWAMIPEICEHPREHMFPWFPIVGTTYRSCGSCGFLFGGSGLFWGAVEFKRARKTNWKKRWRLEFDRRAPEFKRAISCDSCRLWFVWGTRLVGMRLRPSTFRRRMLLVIFWLVN